MGPAKAPSGWSSSWSCSNSKSCQNGGPTGRLPGRRSNELVHADLDAVPRRVLDEHTVDRRVLVLILDLIAAQFHAARGSDIAHRCLRLLVPGKAQGEIARRRGTNVEVLVERAIGRNDQRAGLP